MMKLQTKMVIFLILFMFLQACFIEKENAGSATQISFSSEVLDVFSANCTTSCHSGGAPAGALSLLAADSSITAVYTNLQSGAYLDTTDPDQSTLLLQASNADSGDPHGGGESISSGSSEYALLKNWMLQGAFNDDCTPTPSVSLGTDLAPIFSANCIGSGCHQSGGVDPILDANLFTNIDGADVINNAVPRNSALLRNPLGESSHPVTVFTDENVANWRSMYCWIVQGAQDN
ncbi:MAG: hypothetical protein KDD52_03425 [Bdellovibrionales bacterium]|nr:hypothetical protein [Bdellovibrionales bacterium]